MSAQDGEAPERSVPSEPKSEPPRAEPRASAETSERELLVSLRPLRALAVFACLVTLFARGVSPSLQGAFVGVSRLVDFADLTAGALSQALALFVVLSVAALVLQLLRARVPLWFRLLGVSLATLAVFSAITTIGVVRMPVFIHLTVAISAAVLALSFGVDAIRSAGLVGVVPVMVGLSSLSRGFGAFWAERAFAQHKDLESMRSAYQLAQVLATVGLFLFALAFSFVVVVALRQGSLRLRIAVGVALGFSLALSLRAASELMADESAWGFMVRRFVEKLRVLPLPLVPRVVNGFVCVVAPVLGLGIAAASPRKDRALFGALALSLLAGASAEVPLLGLCLVAGALGLALDRRDPNGVQAALQPRLVA